MNYIPFIVSALLVTGGLVSAAIAIPLAIDEGDDTGNGGWNGDEPLDVQIIENYGSDYVSFTPFSLQFQSFVANGDGELTYLWELEGGPSLSTDPNPTIEIETDFPTGYQTIVLTVTDEDGDTGSDSFTFEVGAPWWRVVGITVDTGNEFPDQDIEPDIGLDHLAGIVLFAFPRIEGPPPVEVFFTASSIRFTYSGFHWDFGDGVNMWSGSSTSHIYSSTGIFNVTLSGLSPTEDENVTIVTEIASIDIMILDTDPVDDIAVDIDLPQVPVNHSQHDIITILADPVEGPAPLYVSFNTNMAPEITSGFMWNFDDGGPVSFDKSPSHTFLNPGTYHVTVSFNGGVGHYGFGEIEIIVEHPQSDDFDVDITVFSTPDPLRFVFVAETSFYESLNFDWEFGPGQYLSGREVAFQYHNYGMRYAKVTAHNDDIGLNATARVDFFIPEEGAPSVYFQIHTDPLDPGYRIFEPLIGSADGPFIYSWLFGDGYGSQEESPVHYYTEEGYYNVQLYVIAPDSGVGYYSEYIYVYSGSGVQEF